MLLDRSIPRSNISTSKMGYIFNVYDSIWRLDGSITVNLGNLPSNIDIDTAEGLTWFNGFDYPS